jgi:hypothetical protein
MRISQKSDGYSLYSVYNFSPALSVLSLHGVSSLPHLKILKNSQDVPWRALGVPKVSKFDSACALPGEFCSCEKYLSMPRNSGCIHKFVLTILSKLRENVLMSLF